MLLLAILHYFTLGYFWPFYRKLLLAILCYFPEAIIGYSIIGYYYLL